MKKVFTFLLFGSSLSFAQLTHEQAMEVAQPYQLGSYSYFENFVGKKGYASGVILTHDGGAAAFGDYESETERGGLLVRFDSKGKEAWKQLVKLQYDEMECQGVIEDSHGNLFVFMLSYNYEKYRGGSERVVCFDKLGNQLWDKTFGEFSMLNSPCYSYIHALDDGRIALRGHIAPYEPKGEEEDPEYYYWEGWLTVKGDMTEKIGQRINWSKDNWQQWYMPE